MLSEIGLLKEKLDLLVQQNASYEEVYLLSTKIDKLLVDYYSKQEEIKDLILGK